MSRICRAEASRLLDFYVNGTLRGPVRAGVGEHLAACADCAREAAEIEAIGRLLSEAPDGILDRPACRPLRLLAAIAAVAVTALLGIWIGTRPGTPPSPVATRTVLLDLGAGATRGGLRPAVSIAADVRFVEVRFSLTVEPGAAYLLRLYDPRGLMIFGPVPVDPWDSLGSSLQRFPAEVLAAGGEYRLAVEESPPGGSSRNYDFAFLVEVDR